MAEGVSMDCTPAHVNFLLDSTTPLEFHITVGQPDASERFGVMKWMLIARSSVFRRMLWESDLRHSKEFTITDVEPTTFRHFLSFMYGHDDTHSLALEDGLKLLYVAEKYDVAELKTKLGRLIRHQLCAEHVFLVLRYEVICRTLPDLWDRVVYMIQYHTKQLFDLPDFCSVSLQAMLIILQQDTLSVPEIEVWRAALKWGKAQEQPPVEEIPPDNLRKTMLPLLKHIRLCTLTTQEFCAEVVPLRVLTGNEVLEVSISLGMNRKSQELMLVCNNIEKRKNGGAAVISPTVITIQNLQPSTNQPTSSYRLYTKGSKIKLIGLQSKTSLYTDSRNPTLVGVTYFCQTKIKISQVKYDNGTKLVTVAVIPFIREVEYDRIIMIPFQRDSTDVDLDANSEYIMEIDCSSQPLSFWYYNTSNSPNSVVYSNTRSSSTSNTSNSPILASSDLSLEPLTSSTGGYRCYSFTHLYYNRV